MPPETIEDSRYRESGAQAALLALGWIGVGNWRFVSPSGSVHDLSAADLTQIERIEREGLFLADL